MTSSWISRIVTQVRKKPGVLAEVINSKAEKDSNLEDLATFISNKIINGEIIEKADDVRRDYE